MHLTTNACESFHAKSNSLFYNSHPNIFQLLEILKQVQTDSKIKIQSLNITPKHKNKHINKKNFIQTQINKLKNKEITNFEFIKIICHKNLPIL